MLICLSCYTFLAYSQVSDVAIERMLTRHVPVYEDVRLNMVAELPRLYLQGKMDTVNAIINYYETNYSTNATIVYYELIQAIKNRTFKEELKNLYRADGAHEKLTEAEYYDRLFL